MEDYSCIITFQTEVCIMHLPPACENISERRRWPLATKRHIVELTLQQGVSVQSIAQKYRIHASAISQWRKLYHDGLLETTKSTTKKQDTPTKFLPITINPTSAIATSGRVVVGINMPSGVSMHIEADCFDFASLGMLLNQVQQ